ncbi:MAG: hypothetical protein R3293_10360 [Candidatus Promineifilaceae bacterium]|nr:hypothetical protein [Candidatus Promineifilaceae bacterium]
MNYISTSILIIGHEGRLTDGLRAVLLAHQWVTEVTIATKFETALKLITPIFPSIIIIDGSDVIGRECEFLRQYISLQGRKPCIVIADTLELGAKAQGAGADAVLMEGFSTNELYDILERFIFEIGGNKRQAENDSNPLSSTAAQLSQTTSQF